MKELTLRKPRAYKEKVQMKLYNPAISEREIKKNKLTGTRHVSITFGGVKS